MLNVKIKSIKLIFFKFQNKTKNKFDNDFSNQRKNKNLKNRRF